MILTVTLNPSVDISYKLASLEIDNVNRVNHISKTAGGKGLNVSRVLRQLDEEVIATGFLGGSLGEFIRSKLFRLGIIDGFVEINQDTRNCIAIIHEGKQTEILESGPEIEHGEQQKFFDHFTHFINKAEIITISGSLPKGLSEDFYVQLLEIAKQRKTKVLLDTKGQLLKQTITSTVKPFLIKPNQAELAELIDQPITSAEDVIQGIQSSQLVGIPWIIVTLGNEGAIVKHKEDLYHIRIPHVETVNPVGSGDSVIAGFAAGFSRQLKGIELIKFGISMGVLNAMENNTGQINVDKIDWCINQMDITKLN